MKFKKLLLILFTFVVSFVMFGCATINYEVAYKSGVVISKMEIDLSTMTASNRMSAYRVIVAYHEQLHEQYEINLINLYSNIYGEEFANTEVYKTNLEKINFIHMKTNGKFAFDITHLESGDYPKSAPVIVAEEKFATIYAYLMFYYPSAFEYNAKENAVVISDTYKSMIDIPLGGEFKEQDDLFITKYIQTCAPFYYNGEQPKFFRDDTSTGAKQGETLVEVLARKTGKSESDVDYIFKFSTPYQRVHSDGSVMSSSQGYTHTWNLGGVDGKVTLWRNYVNSIPWYIIAAGVGIICFVVGAIVIFIINKTKKKQGLKAMKKIDNLIKTPMDNNKK